MGLPRVKTPIKKKPTKIKRTMSRKLSGKEVVVTKNVMVQTNILRSKLDDVASNKGALISLRNAIDKVWKDAINLLKDNKGV